MQGRESMKLVSRCTYSFLFLSGFGTAMMGYSIGSISLAKLGSRVLSSSKGSGEGDRGEA